MHEVSAFEGRGHRQVSSRDGIKTGSEMNLADDEDSHESIEGENDDDVAEEDPEDESSDDSLATLPSVRELASKFMPKKSPESPIVVSKAFSNKVRSKI